MNNGNMINRTNEYDKELLENVSKKVRQKALNTKMIAVASIFLPLLLLAVLFLPLIPVSPKKLDIKVRVNTEGNGYHLTRYSKNSDYYGNYKDTGDFGYWTRTSENTVLICSDNETEPFDETVFSKLVMYETYPAVIAVSDDLDFDVANVITISSDCPIEHYSTDLVNDDNGNPYYIIKNVKTSVVSKLKSFNKRKYSVVLLELSPIDHVAVKDLFHKEKTVWYASHEK